MAHIKARIHEPIIVASRILWLPGEGMVKKRHDMTLIVHRVGRAGALSHFAHRVAGACNGVDPFRQLPALRGRHDTIGTAVLQQRGWAVSGHLCRALLNWPAKIE
jgi:hypothetical protein